MYYLDSPEQAVAEPNQIFLFPILNYDMLYRIIRLHPFLHLLPLPAYSRKYSIGLPSPAPVCYNPLISTAMTELKLRSNKMIILAITSSTVSDIPSTDINFDLLISVFSLLIAIYVFKAGPKYALLQERYEKLIFPLFNYIEPYLFCDYNAEYTKHLLQIFNANKHLARAKLIECVYYLESDSNQNSFNRLCRCLISEYDSLSFILGLGLHSITYRINRNQYKTNFMFNLYTAFYCFLLIIAELLSVIAVAFMIYFTVRTFLIR